METAASDEAPSLAKEQTSVAYVAASASGGLLADSRFNGLREWFLGLADPTSLKYSLTGWFIFGVVVSLIPLGCISYQRWDNGTLQHLWDLFDFQVLSGGEVIITSVVLASASVGDLMVRIWLVLIDRSRSMPHPGIAFINVAAAFLFLICGAWIYGEIDTKNHEAGVTSTLLAAHNDSRGQIDKDAAHLRHVADVSFCSLGLALVLGAGSIWLRAMEEGTALALRSNILTNDPTQAQAGATGAPGPHEDANQREQA
ncbi:hypothetical protein [Mycobacterium sp. 852002-51057_SCH5723018]|uniref:hypothetical protein n=1 Tax=Mycobacterium sp. 852002-51057_SCH5723018 TaxID=1834094 RepID=UPI0012E9350E|nr:hypothetical protein [Mycobacterium sp. 852002-51057_SCH5723018]